MVSLSQLFNFSKASDDIPYMPRQINLSGNIVHFSIPENFSRDFPAEPMIEKLDLDQVGLFAEGKPIELLRRWWDFKTDSFFSRNIGTMMMTIHVYDTPESLPEINNIKNFLDILLFNLKKRYELENKGRKNEEIKYFPEFYRSFYSEKINDQLWIRGGASTEDESQVEFHRWKPITSGFYIGVEFHFAPNNNIGMREFIDGYARDMLEKIMATFDIVYSKDNTIKNKLDKISQLEFQQAIEKME